MEVYLAFGLISIGSDPSVDRTQQRQHKQFECMLADRLLFLLRRLSDFSRIALRVQDEVFKLRLSYSSLTYAFFESMCNQLQLVVTLLCGCPQRRPDVGLGITQNRIEAADRLLKEPDTLLQDIQDSPLDGSLNMEVEDRHRMVLTDSIDTSDSLFDTHRIPRQIIVH